ncbi:hypothetical protein HDU86_001927 [Geranomyces michiganensis]|nr:hypothetical protein HDU86_001927 [Geranomyces michiganensis]
MPELPEVERARKLIHDAFVGQQISAVTTFVDDIVYSECTNVDFESLKGRTLVDTGRRGKVFYLLMDAGPHPVLHLGMTGSVRIKGKPGLEYKDFSTADDDWPPKYAKFVLTFTPSNDHLAFTDPRRLARIRLIDGNPLTHPPISDLGFDPSLSMPDLPTFAQSLISRKCPIKAVLLDQKFSAGVGNWVCDEVLYQAKIHPGTHAAALDGAEIAALHKALRDVVVTAVGVNADSKLFPAEWLFHQRWGKKGSRTATRAGAMPDGSEIVFVTVAGRTSAVVPSCQILHGVGGGAEAKSKNKEKQPALKRENTSSKDRQKRKTKDSESEDLDTDLKDEDHHHLPPSKPKTVRQKRVKQESVTIKAEESSVDKAEQEQPASTAGLRRSTRLRRPVS